MLACQAANSGDDAARPGIHEAVRQLCFGHNLDNNDANYDFVKSQRTDVALVLQKMLAMYIYHLL